MSARERRELPPDTPHHLERGDKMEEQEFIIRVKALPCFYRHFSRIDAGSLARAIRDSLRANSRGCVLPTPFEITVKWHDETASAGGVIGSLIPILPGETVAEPEADREHIYETVSSMEAK